MDDLLLVERLELLHQVLHLLLIDVNNEIFNLYSCVKVATAKFAKYRVRGEIVFKSSGLLVGTKIVFNLWNLAFESTTSECVAISHR